ncbi:TonB-dependent receptor domain-containing protein [Roseateles aquae]|nr:TonB-dependent receptor [Paucibacter sp. APW11]
MLGVTAFTHTALAQDAVLQRVEVTGSNIKRVDAEPVSPVQTFRRVDIDRTGVSTVRELLEIVSGTGSVLNDLGDGNSFAPGASAAALRNLGKQSTLVLLNSRRVAPFPLADYSEVFTNIDALPLDAVERVEILKNGGSAIYGSDAVAGVINVITKADYQGLTLKASHGASLYKGKFGDSSASITAGYGDLTADKFNVLANVELYKRDRVMWAEVIGRSNPDYAANSNLFDGLSIYSFPGNVNGKALPGCTRVVGGLCRFYKADYVSAQPNSERSNLLLSAHFRPSSGITAFTELTYSHIKTEYPVYPKVYGPGQNPVQWAEAQTGKQRAFYYRGLPAHHPLNPSDEESDLAYRFMDQTVPDSTTTDQYRVLAGMQGSFHGWDWEAAIGQVGAKTNSIGRNAFSDSGFKAVIGDYNADTLAADFFNKPNGYKIGQINSAEVLNQLFPEQGTRGHSAQTFFDAKVSGELMQLPAGPLSMAAGLDLRRESMRMTPSNNLLAGDIVGYGISTADASRTFGAVFSELDVPIIKGLEAQLAARVDKFPGFGAHVSPKVALRFQPDKRWVLRGTYERGFRAPNITEAAPSLKTAFDPVNDPKRCDAATALSHDLADQAKALELSDPATAAMLSARSLEVTSGACGFGVPLATKNNANLKPETSRAFSFGLVFEPMPGASASLDYWSIRRVDEIGLVPSQETLYAEDRQPPGTVKRDSLANDHTFTAAERAKYGVTVGQLIGINNAFVNLGKTKVSGIDFGVKGKTATPWGKLALEVDGTYAIDYHSWNISDGRWGDNLIGRYDYSRWVITSGAYLESGSFSHSLRNTWRSGRALQQDYTDSDWTLASCTDPDGKGLPADKCRLAGYSRWDYTLAYSGVKNLRLFGTIRNLFAHRPPLDLRGAGAPNTVTPPMDPGAEDVKGRSYRIGLEYRFF